MKLTYKKQYAEVEFDMDTIELLDLPARPVKGERHPLLCITEGKNCMNFQIAILDFGSLEDENAMAKEIARRWNLAKKGDEKKPKPKREKVLKKVDVLFGDDWVTFDSISAAARAIGVLYNNLTIALRKGTDCKGYKVRYANSGLDACLAEIEAKNRQPYQPTKPVR